MTALVERLRAATGADTRLNADIHEALGLPFEMEYWTESDTTPVRNLSKVPPYTASVDAALALVERCLPGWKYGLHHHNRLPGMMRAYVVQSSPFRPMPFMGDAPTAPLAILIALLTALSEPNHE